MARKLFFVVSIIVIAGLLAVCAKTDQRTIPFVPHLLSIDDQLTLLPERIERFKNTLTLSVQEVETKCHASGQSIPVKLEFQNVTDNPIIFYARFEVGPTGDKSNPYFTVFSEITTGEGETVSYGQGSIDVLELPVASPDDFIEIQAHDDFATTINFEFPDLIVDKDSLVPLPEGEYLVRFFYINMDIGPSVDSTSSDRFDWNAWVGEVQSNQIEVCIQNP